ncbi:MAG: recombinase family protein [Oscillospiraceae bacterium]
MKRAVAYCRVSTDNKDQANSLENQIRYFNEYIEKNPNLQLVKIYYDEGISGTSLTKREQFNQMLLDAEKGIFDIIFTKEVSRFARNTVDTLSCIRKLKNLGIGVIFMNDSINTLNNDGELRLTIMASIAQEESRKISERVKWGQKRRMEQGIVFGRDLLGYSVIDGKLYINQEEAKIVRLIFHKFLIEGKGTHIIAKELHENGINPKIAKTWSNIVILKILKNEKYVGDLCQGKTYTPDYLTHKKEYNHNLDNMIYITNHHEPIIDRDTWNKTQIELNNRSISKDKKEKYSNRYWCSGKIICGKCSQHFVSKTKTIKDGSKYKSWRCSSNAKYGSKKLNTLNEYVGCDNQSVNDKVLLHSIGYILKLVNINKQDITDTIANEIKLLRTSKPNLDTSKMYKDIEKFENKKISLVDNLLEGILSKEEVSKQKEFYDKQINKILNKILEVEKEEEFINHQEQKFQPYIDNLKFLLNFDEPIEEICHEVLDKIIIYKNNIIEVFLKYLPMSITLKYFTTGRLSNYKVDFELIKIDEIKS